MPAPSPPPGSDAFNTELAKALRALPPASPSLKSKLGFAVTRCISKVRGFWKPAKALQYPRAAPPTREGSPRPPAIFVTTEGARFAAYRPTPCDSPLSAASSGAPATPQPDLRGVRAVLEEAAVDVEAECASPANVGAAVSEKDLDALFDLVHEEELGDADSLVAVCSPWLGPSKSFESDYSDLCSPLEEGERAEEVVEVEVENTRLAEFLHALWKERHGGEGVAHDEWRALGTIVEEEGA